MKLSEYDLRIIKAEMEFKTFIISGAGGQNLQKSSTGAALHWNAAQSHVSEGFKNRLLTYIKQHELSADLMFRSQNHRSLDLNKKESFAKLLKFIEKALFIPKKRIATKPTYSSKQKKLKGKKIHAEVKKNRQKVSRDF